MATLILGPVFVAASDGCSGQPEAQAAVLIDSMETAKMLIETSDIEAYRTGVSREIGIRGEAERLGFVVREEMVDSSAAEAAGLPVARYRVVSQAVEALLARGPKSELNPQHTLAADAESVWTLRKLSLDSLRLEALVLRARTGN